MAAVEPAVVEAFDDAQRRGWRMLAAVVREVSVGMSETDVDALARSKLRDFGFDRWYHPPEVQVGDRIAKPGLFYRPSASVRLRDGDLVSIDLGPCDEVAYADVGITLHLRGDGEAEPEVLGVARECTRGAVGFTSQWKTVGEVFVFSRAWAANHRMSLASTRSVGHAVLPAQALGGLSFPQAAHWVTLLRRHRVHFLHPVRISGIWALRPVISDGARSAAFEEMVYIDGETKRILGRDSLEEVGTLPAL